MKAPTILVIFSYFLFNLACVAAAAVDCVRFVHQIGADPVTEIQFLQSVDTELEAEEARRLTDEQSKVFEAYESAPAGRGAMLYRRRVSGLRGFIAMERRVRQARLLLAKLKPKFEDATPDEELDMLRTLKRVARSADTEKITADVLRTLVEFSQVYELLADAKAENLSITKSKTAKAKMADRLATLKTIVAIHSDELKTLYEKLPENLFEDFAQLEIAVAFEDRVGGCCGGACWHCPLNLNMYSINEEAFFEGGLGVMVPQGDPSPSNLPVPDLGLYRAKERLKTMMPYVLGPAVGG